MKIDIVNLIVFVVVGAVAGWLAGVLMKGRGFGALGNILVGIVGAFLGGFVFKALGIHVAAGLVGLLITAFAGAVILLLLARLLR